MYENPAKLEGLRQRGGDFVSGWLVQHTILHIVSVLGTWLGLIFSL